MALLPNVLVRLSENSNGASKNWRRLEGIETRSGDDDDEAAASIAAREFAEAIGRMEGPTSDQVTANGTPKLPEQFKNADS